MSGPRSHGYSLIELLVVLAIVGVLAMAGSAQVGNRQGTAVRGLTAALGGELTDAYLSAGANKLDLSTSGSWSDGSLVLEAGTRRFEARAQSDRKYAGISSGNQWMDLALGGGTTLASTVPGQAEPLRTALTNALFRGTASDANFVDGNGNTKQYSGFYIAIVGLRGGEPYEGAPVAVLIASGPAILKFYKADAASPWRRL